MTYIYIMLFLYWLIGFILNIDYLYRESIPVTVYNLLLSSLLSVVTPIAKVMDSLALLLPEVFDAVLIDFSKDDENNGSD